ncbi:hypothetical protein TNCV_4972941 [Trichonephila clavipes]|nr:hypothetical protein TNCV_4972941 [Trichonephila clavipes]
MNSNGLIQQQRTNVISQKKLIGIGSNGDLEYDFAWFGVEGEHLGGGQSPPTSLSLPPTSQEDSRFDGYLKYLHAVKAIYFYKPPCLLWDSIPGPTAGTVPFVHRSFELLTSEKENVKESENSGQRVLKNRNWKTFRVLPKSTPKYIPSVQEFYVRSIPPRFETVSLSLKNQKY